MSEMRKVEVFKDNQWEEIELEQLRNGDLFRMFEPDGSPVEDINGKKEFIVVGNPYFNIGYDTWVVNVK